MPATPRFITAAEAQADDLGDVKGPDTSGDSNIALFDGTTGKLLKAAGVVEGVATIDSTTNVLIGDGAGNAVDSGAAIGDLGSYLAANTARVDPSGSDETGTIGNLAKPFLTVQGALTALEAQGGFLHTQPAVVILPMLDTVENVTTSIPYLVLCGPTNTDNQGCPAIGSLTITDDATGEAGIVLGLTNVWVNAVLTPNAEATIFIILNSAIIQGDITTPTSVDIRAPYRTGSVGGTINAPGDLSTISGLLGSYASGQNAPVINCPGQSVIVYDSLISDVEAADSVELNDSRIIEIPNSAAVEPTYNNSNFFNPALMDFSTLPASDPEIAGRAWMDEGVFSISTGPP